MIVTLLIEQQIASDGNRKSNRLTIWSPYGRHQIVPKELSDPDIRERELFWLNIIEKHGGQIISIQTTTKMGKDDIAYRICECYLRVENTFNPLVIDRIFEVEQGVKNT